MIFRRRRATAQADRRRHHRQDDRKELAIDVEFSTSDGTVWPCMLVDLSHGGARLRFPVHKRPELQTGDKARLWLNDEAWTNPVEVTARVAWYMRDTIGHWFAGFEFEDSGELERQLDIFNQRSFSRRRCKRVELGAHTTVQVDLRWGGNELTLPVHDISEFGFGVLMGKAEAMTFRGVERVAVELRMPGEQKPFRMQATVENRIPVVDDILVGFDFDFRGKEGYRLLTALKAFTNGRK